jgi:hypothetical protein
VAKPIAGVRAAPARMFERTVTRRERRGACALHGTAKGWLLPFLFLLAAADVSADDNQGPWYYAVGTQRGAQQGDFCLQEKRALEVARTFEQQGARAGYEALDRAADCTITVQSFTPLRVIKRVPIATRDGGQYTVKIVEIQTVGGKREYLITTREVRE